MEKLIKGQRYWLDNRKDVSAVYERTDEYAGDNKVDIFIDPVPEDAGSYYIRPDGTVPFNSTQEHYLYEKA